MSFKQFLIERHVNGKYNIAFHKLLSALDSAHVEASEGKFEFNFGSVIKDSTFTNLNVRISKGSQDYVKFGSNNSGKYYIVVSTTKLPERMELDTFLSSNETVKNKFVQFLADYTANHLNPNEIEKNKHEKTEELYDKGNYETKYSELVSSIEKKFQEYNKAIEELDKNYKSTTNDLKKSSIEMAKENLRKEYFGNSDNEFIKIVMKMPEAEFITLLDKDMKDKTVKRLNSFYDQKV